MMRNNIGVNLLKTQEMWKLRFRMMRNNIGVNLKLHII